MVVDDVEEDVLTGLDQGSLLEIEKVSTGEPIDDLADAPTGTSAETPAGAPTNAPEAIFDSGEDK